MWNLFRKKESEPKLIDMTPGEKDIICMFADGNDSYRDLAIKIYRQYLPHLEICGSVLEMKFMSEVDTSVPDLSLRARYREILLDK